MKAKGIAHKIHQIAAERAAEIAAANAKATAIEAAKKLGARREVTDEAILNLLILGDYAKYLNNYQTANLCMALILQTLSEVGSTKFEMVIEDSGLPYFDLLGVQHANHTDYLCIPWPLLTLNNTTFANARDDVHLCHCDFSCYPDRYTGCKDRIEWFADVDKLANAFGVSCSKTYKELHHRTPLLTDAAAANALKQVHADLGHTISMLVQAGIKVGSAPQWLVETATHQGESNPLRKPVFDLLLKIMADFKAARA